MTELVSENRHSVMKLGSLVHCKQEMQAKRYLAALPE
jgi:hypothetical protein